MSGLCAASITGLLLLAFCLNAQAQELSWQSTGSRAADDSLMVDGLRKRRLFDLAEKYCAEKLANPELDPTERTRLVLDLMRTQTARAAVAGQTESEQRWVAATKTANDFIDAYRNQPRILLIEVQRALIHLTHGRLIQQQIEADIVPPESRERALEELNTCNKLLADITRAVALITPERRAQGPAEHELTLEELAALESNVQFQSAMCTLNRAALYPADDQLNRINALGIAIEGFEKVRRKTARNQSVWWQNELATVECYRLLGDLRTSTNVLSGMAAHIDSPDSSNGQAVLRERILNSISARDASGQRGLVDEYSKIVEPDAELSLAGMKLLMSLAKLDERNSREWQSLAAAQVRKIENAHGAYRGRLAELQLIGRAAGSTTDHSTTGNSATNDPAPGTADISGTTDIDVLLRLGDTALRRGNTDDALKAYTKAVAGADAVGDSLTVFSTTVRISNILEKSAAHNDAAAQLLWVAGRFPDHERSAAVHLRGCWNVARVLNTTNEESVKAEIETQFVTALKENISRWPESEAVDQARVWLAGHLQNRKRWEPAARVWMQVAPTSRRAVEAIRQANVCLVNRMTAMQRDHQTVAAIADSEVELLQQRLGEIGSAESDTWTEQHTSIANSIVKLQTGFGSRRFTLVPLMQRTVAECSADNRDEATSWLVVAMADELTASGGEGLSSLNEQVLNISRSFPALMRCDTGLARLIARYPDNTTLHEARLAVVSAAMSRAPDDATTATWRARYASTLVSAGRHSEAVSMLQELADANPDSATAQMQLARCLSEIDGNEAQQKALSQWRIVAKKLKPRSDNWFEAKYHIALVMEQSGDKAGALKLLQYIRATGADWSESEFAAPYEELLRRCGS